MPEARAEPYNKKVIRPRPDATGIVYMKHWGAVGDYMYFLTFVSPLLRSRADKRRVLAADVYARYRGRPILEMCQANGLIDELWTHKRKNAGPTLVPPEYLAQAKNPNPNNELYTPGVYYDAYLTGPGVLPYPVEKLRHHMKMEEKYLIPIPDWGVVHDAFPLLQKPYITYHHASMMKRKNNILPAGILPELSKIGVQIIILTFPSDLRQMQYFQQVGELPNVIICPVVGPVHSLWIQAHAACHVGLESSQLLGATIHDVPTFFFPVGGYPVFDNELCLSPVWTILDWDVPPEWLREAVEEVIRDADY